MRHQISWLSLQTPGSETDFSAHYIRSCPSGVPTESSPQLSLETCIENAHSAHSAYLTRTAAHFPEAAAISSLLPPQQDPLPQQPALMAAARPCLPRASSIPQPHSELSDLPLPLTGWQREAAESEHVRFNTASSLLREPGRHKPGGLPAARRRNAVARSGAGSRWQHLHLPGAASAVGAVLRALPDAGEDVCQQRSPPPAKCVTAVWPPASPLAQSLLPACWAAPRGEAQPAGLTAAAPSCIHGALSGWIVAKGRETCWGNGLETSKWQDRPQPIPVKALQYSWDCDNFPFKNIWSLNILASNGKWHCIWVLERVILSSFLVQACRLWELSWH